jgi:hypothetical protein
MICKIVVSNSFLTGQNQNLTQQQREQWRHLSPNFIQQISSLQVCHQNILTGSAEFRIRINCFEGLTKGLFISCNVDELTEIKFYINNVLRVNYDLFYIQTYCVKHSNKMLYMPFNGLTSFKERSISTFDGSINFSLGQTFVLNLKFNCGQNKVCVHNLYTNKFAYQNGMGALSVAYQPGFTRNDISMHPLTPLVEGVLHFDATLFDLSGNFVGITSGNAIESGNEISNATISNAAISNAVNIDLSGNFIGTNPIVMRQIEEEWSTCDITHEEIAEGGHYMQCHGCNHNFSEAAIKTWLRQRAIKTCPMCRVAWSNYVVYLNINEVRPN